MHFPTVGAVTAVTFSSNASRVAAWDDSQTLTVWDTVTGQIIAQQSFADGLGEVEAMQFARNDERIALRYVDSTEFYGGKRNRHRFRPPHSPYMTGVYIWDYLTNLPAQFVNAGGWMNSNLVISPDGMIVGTVNSGATQRTGVGYFGIRLFNVDTEALMGSVGGRAEIVSSIVFNPARSSELAMLTSHGVVRLWDYPSSAELLALSVLPERVRSIAYNQTGDELATAGIDGKVRVWNSGTGELLRVYPDQSADIYQLYFSDGGAVLAFGNPDTYPRVWDAETLETITDFRIAVNPPTQTPDVSLSAPTIPPLPVGTLSPG